MNRNKTQQNFQQYQKRSTIIFATLLLGQVFFATVTVFLNQTGGPLNGDDDDDDIRKAFMILVPIFFLVTYFLGNLVVNKRIKLAKEDKQLKNKLEIYRSANIIKYAMLEGTAFFAIITYLLTGELLLLGFAVMMMLLFATYYPSKEKLIKELELNREEQAILEDPMAVVAEVANC